MRSSYSCNSYILCSISSRFSNTVLTNTASSGPLKKQQQQQQLDSCPQLFVAEPREIVFTSYQIGESYTVSNTPFPLRCSGMQYTRCHAWGASKACWGEFSIVIYRNMAYMYVQMAAALCTISSCFSTDPDFQHWSFQQW